MKKIILLLSLSVSAIAQRTIEQKQVQGLQDSLSNSVKKIAGKGLSANDYTTTEKNKLLNIPSDAQMQINNIIKIQNSVSKISSNFIYDDFDSNNQLLAGRVTPTGQTWNISGTGAGTIGIVGGLVPAGDNFYASIQNGSAIKYLGATFSFSPYLGTNDATSPQVVLITQNSSLDLGTMLHFQLTWTGWSIQKRIGGGAFINIGGGSYTLETNGTIYRAAMRISGNTVTLEFPDGTTTSITDSDIGTMSMTAGTWQLQQMSASSALQPRYHSIFMGEKKQSSLSVQDGSSSQGSVTQLQGYGFGRRTNRKYTITSDGWYRIAYNTSVSGFTIQSKIKISTTGYLASQFEANVIATGGSVPIVQKLFSNGGFQLANVRVGTDATAAYVDVQIQNTSLGAVTLMADMEGFINLYPIAKASPTTPTLISVNAVTSPVNTTLNTTVNTTGWYTIATKVGGSGGFLLSGKINIFAYDVGRSTMFTLNVTATPSSPIASNAVQLYNVTGLGSTPLTQIRVSRNSGTSDVQIEGYFANASTNVCTFIADYSGFLGVPSSLVSSSALATENVVYNIINQYAQGSRLKYAQDIDNNISFITLTEGGSYQVVNTESRIYQNTGANTALTFTMPNNPVNGQTVYFNFDNAVSTLTINPFSGYFMYNGSTYSIPSGGGSIGFVYRSANLRWYKI